MCNCCEVYARVGRVKYEAPVLQSINKFIWCALTQINREILCSPLMMDHHIRIEEVSHLVSRILVCQL